MSAIKRVLGVLLLLGLSLYPPVSDAQTAFDGLRLSFDREAPVQILSERLDFDPEARSLRFSGDVIITQPGLEIRCDQLDVLTDTGGRIVRLQAKGSVRMSREGWRAKAGLLTYDRADKTLILEEAPQIERGDNIIRGHRMVFHIEENRLRVEAASTEVSFPKEATP